MKPFCNKYNTSFLLKINYLNICEKLIEILKKKTFNATFVVFQAIFEVFNATFKVDETSISFKKFAAFIINNIKKILTIHFIVNLRDKINKFKLKFAIENILFLKFDIY